MLSSKINILVAEDEEVNFYLLDMWLRDFCTVIHANNGQETIDVFKSNNAIDLILMDIKMPIINGIEAAIAIRKIDQNIPIIAQSAFVMRSETEKILSAGCNEILAKPIRKDQFQKMLIKYIPSLKF